jgi:hypothetical protein
MRYYLKIMKTMNPMNPNESQTKKPSGKKNAYISFAVVTILYL